MMKAMQHGVESFLSAPPVYPNAAFSEYQGLGMTSQRTRDRLVKRLMELGIQHEDVLKAIRVTPRHLFLDEALASRAYEDTALPIGYAQTISQPWVVAKMSAYLFEKEPLKRVLEIGTGSGYQTAILSQLADQVFSVERIEPLLRRAQSVLRQLQIDNVDLALSDGQWGWPQKAPFDGILSAAAPPKVPETLFEQLKEGGRLVIPIGDQEQSLYGFEKTSTGVKKTLLADVMFVPMLDGVKQNGECET
jgi:protein-L-isoaspartate(D-aspartate) O-methyltransferase